MLKISILFLLFSISLFSYSADYKKIETSNNKQDKFQEKIMTEKELSKIILDNEEILEKKKQRIVNPILACIPENFGSSRVEECKNGKTKKYVRVNTCDKKDIYVRYDTGWQGFDVPC